MFGWVKSEEYKILLEENTDLREEIDKLRLVIGEKNKHITKLRYQIGGDGNSVLRSEAAAALKAYNAKCLEVGNLKGELEATKIERDMYKKLYNGLVAPRKEEPEKEAKTDSYFPGPREDGLKTKEIQMMAYRAKVDGEEKGEDPIDTAQDFCDKAGIDIVSFPAYCSHGKNHYKKLMVELTKNTGGRITRKQFPISQIDPDGRLHSDSAWQVQFGDKIKHEEWQKMLKYYHSSIS